ncbi:MAG: hypothetical protein M1831_001082 [Alyxoria varia]|nr:MAG: hypothetical protein M1831_001082 [Alyxoria varia]
MSTPDASKWEPLEYKRQLETFGVDDMPVTAVGPRGETDGVCLPGELTDKGRETTMALGQRIRRLYVDQLEFLPDKLSSPLAIHLRSTPIPRALESTQQAFYGLYPSTSRTPDCPTPTISTRAISEENLFPNEGSCKRFAQLAAAFADRAAQVWNDSIEMRYINRKIGKWMPENSKTIAVDGKPRLSGIMDTLNATLAHGPDTKLPSEFEGAKLRQYIDKIAVSEWYDGYKESREYRMLGTGSLMAEMATRMCRHVEQQQVQNHILPSESSRPEAPPVPPRLYLAGAHDTTLAGTLASLGAFGDNPWPPYTSHLAIELFRDKSHSNPSPAAGAANNLKDANPSTSASLHPQQKWFTSIPLIGQHLKPTPPTPTNTSSTNPAHAPTSSLPLANSQTDPSAPSVPLDSYYVRIRYNDVPVQIPGCKIKGNHLSGDRSFCTLRAFREIVEGFAPKDWRGQCRENLREPSLPMRGEDAGWPVVTAAEDGGY